MEEDILENQDNPKEKPVKPPLKERIRYVYKALPDKKKYLEFFAALLTVPVLLTVLLSNISNLQNQKKSAVITPTPTPIERMMQLPKNTLAPGQSITPTSSSTATPTPGPECVKQIGVIAIEYPEENSTVTGDPICLDIVRQSQNYCSVVWSYRINGSAWSDYTDKSICMYGLTAGVKNLELRVKSIVSTDTTILKRTFTASGTTPTPVATLSAMINNE